ncbi:uncharacterized protein N7473_012824 [Penicillium subrubescens]|uniref:uncharacterized protein n=1 Tax=Penicillium subrubescens TaxID=1316194 RepID=UPI00254595B4|nr:uncharacterized protein N7473_012824 [Penicillium subrubescens]KAJ5875477.1 hypothetical protein N7473_012824 [Penicillium subrubescens]
MSDTQSTDDVIVINPDGDVLLFTRDECDETVDYDESPKYTKFLLSSKHVALASAYFRAQFSTNWREGRAVTVNGAVELYLSTTEHDSKTMEILLNAIHGSQWQIPHPVSCGRLWKVALATDYFLCREALQTWSLWCCQQLVRLFPTELTDWSWELIYITYIFRWKSLFPHLTQLTQQKCLASAHLGPSPIPKWILEVIFGKRNAYLKQCFDLLDLQIAYLGAQQIHCTFKCNAKKAGALMKYSGQFKTPSTEALSGEEPAVTTSACSPFSFCQAAKEWENPNHNSRTLNTASKVTRSWRPSPRTPRRSPCADESLLGDQLLEHIAQMEEKLNGISHVPEWGLEFKVSDYQTKVMESSRFGNILTPPLYPLSPQQPHFHAI